jgi:hypothetical protein
VRAGAPRVALRRLAHARRLARGAWRVRAARAAARFSVR